MKANRMAILLVTAAMVTGALAASCDVRAPIRTIPTALIVLPEAEDTQISDIYDGQVSYTLKAPFPGERSIEEFRRRLVEQGWHRRERDILNPGNTFATTARWRTVKIEDHDVIAWSEQWENANGDVVVYGFKYAVPAGASANSDPKVPMQVLISYFRADTVKALESEAGERQKR
jgi:hypothetical protein